MARKAPLVPGHEIVAEVVQTGEAVAEFSPGDRIFVHHHAPCMRCRFCQRGDHVHCLTWRKTKLIPGGLSELAIVPREVISADAFLLPREISDDAATFVEPLACVVKAAHRAGVGPGDRILVIGLGVMGMLQVMLARREVESTAAFLLPGEISDDAATFVEPRAGGLRRPTAQAWVRETASWSSGWV